MRSSKSTPGGSRVDVEEHIRTPESPAQFLGEASGLSGRVVTSQFQMKMLGTLRSPCSPSPASTHLQPRAPRTLPAPPDVYWMTPFSQGCIHGVPASPRPRPSAGTRWRRRSTRARCRRGRRDARSPRSGAAAPTAPTRRRRRRGTTAHPCGTGTGLAEVGDAGDHGVGFARDLVVEVEHVRRASRRAGGGSWSRSRPRSRRRVALQHECRSSRARSSATCLIRPPTLKRARGRREARLLVGEAVGGELDHVRCWAR